jgi:hypothetical protein
VQEGINFIDEGVVVSNLTSNVLRKSIKQKILFEKEG